MNAFLAAATAIVDRLGGDTTYESVIDQVAKQSWKFQKRIDSALKDSVSYPANWGLDPVASREDAILVEIHETITKAMCRLEQPDREALVYWVLQEVFARNQIERIATQMEQPSC